ncbi:uroporphyrinogen-III C-methyltransferase [Actinotalea sp. BY-33]|uniref:Uroporphyrinogen-III C-methyltransferase n=1 Tax=Actinotalea soli TaxID=2819234 RepID=A0A939LN04_9CELL|nr:uroporphyrinogen-III C-methyltransferase [Actinotalea soli]MBO1750631.1 uroporphyrinogen-III C-methyltransferase [Actinotalea soli]
MTALIGLDLTDRQVLVVGGGPVSARRATALLAEGARIRLVAPCLCEDLAALADLGAVDWRARDVTAADLADVWLVHTATGDRAVDAAVARWAEERRVWCVVASEATAGTARTPATAREGDLVIGVVSEGLPDPARVAAVRDSVAEHLRDGADLRRRRRVPGAPGHVVLVGGGPGAVDLLTLRARRALAEADVVVTDRLGPRSVLEHLPSAVEVIDVGKTPGHHPVPQHEINRILVEQAQRGRSVVRLKGGDPFVYGRGGEEVLACREAGVPVEVVPGISSALAVPAAAGIPLTHRGTVAAVHVVNGHDGLDESARVAMRERSATVVVLMGVSALGTMAAEALEHGTDPQTPVAIVERGTTPSQRVTRGPLQEIAELAREAGVRAPAIVVVGDVAAPGLLDPPPAAMLVS